MGLFDLAASWIDVLLVRWLIVPFAISIVLAPGMYFLGGQTPASLR